jgi:dihydrofolate synthase/folylpolyglutamate synthase
MTFDSIKSVEEYLSKIPKFQAVGTSAANFDLDRFKQFCVRLGDFQDKFPSIHIGGTNGKGSTSRILGKVFQDSGYKVGVYTSPHVINFNERFTINDEVIPDGELIAFFQEHVQILEEYKLTYYEISTAIAFWWFAESKVDLAIIEVGLGGRLDATNVITPLVSVITSIALDHTDILGDTIEEIAREKGGIIKRGVPVVIGDLPKTAEEEVINIAKQKGSLIYSVDELEAKFLEPGLYQLTIDSHVIKIKTNLFAPVQAKNIAIAWQVTRLLKDDFPISIEHYIKSLKRVDLGIGRFSRLSENHRWYFDGGHNAEAVKALKHSVQQVGSISEAFLVLALMRDKINPEMVNEFSEFKNIYYYQLNFDRAATFDDIKQRLPQVNPFPVDQDQQKLLLKGFDSELVIFAGSFYFYGTVRDWVRAFA